MQRTSLKHRLAQVFGGHSTCKVAIRERDFKIVSPFNRIHIQQYRVVSPPRGDDGLDLGSTVPLCERAIVAVLQSPMHVSS